jgi:tetratricopeptide (TPR) repeat protein
MSYLESGDLPAAETAFKAALAMYPEYVGENNAYEGLASIYRARGQTADLIGVLTRYLQLAEDEVDAALELSALHAQRGDLSSAATMLERSLHVAPYDVEVRGQLADLYDRMQHFGEAVDHRRAVVALDPPDRAGAYYRLARTLHGGGQTRQARRAVLHSLEIAPDFRDAQKLLLEITE